ncbi:nuclear transport factor 2 family protein [Gryllotalpicola reticulitermitis]|uniref:Nuclear transport factor 2 family protein n=1 Tax=Gryllotalpicola reticulitermitis TaxID=1184153 RepID=A0ABV8Q7E7_9MICO
MPSAERAIENLIARYAFLVDDGDFTGLGELLDAAEFNLGTAAARGKADIEELAAAVLQTYPDGTPRTRHVTTNLIIEVDADAGTASSRSYFTVFQQTDDLPLQPVASGRYRDAFELYHGQWRFAAREVSTDLVGDTSHHVKQAS